jgi:murein DD-endopeptidase MepM/ murein hydrolase activator NlpD
VSSEFGARWGKLHKGIDIAADAGEPVYAIAPGEVIYAGDGLRGYGNVVILRHDRQRTSLYAHNSVLKVKQGEVIAAGTVIALLGNTGHSTGPHVHFEIRDGDTPLDPRKILPATRLGAVIVNPDAEPQGDGPLLARNAALPSESVGLRYAAAGSASSAP